MTGYRLPNSVVSCGVVWSMGSKRGGFSQVSPPFNFTKLEVEFLTNRIQNGGTEVVEVSLPPGTSHNLGTKKNDSNVESGLESECDSGVLNQECGLNCGPES